jgi:hypothetical protein
LSGDRHHGSFGRAEIDPEVGRGCAIDDAQPHLGTLFDIEHLRIGQRAVVGEEGVVGDVVQVDLGAVHRTA